MSIGNRHSLCRFFETKKIPLKIMALIKDKKKATKLMVANF